VARPRLADAFPEFVDSEMSKRPVRTYLLSVN